MPSIPREQVPLILEQLQTAVRAHEQWFADFIRRLVCRLPHDPDNQSERAAHLCAFGRWIDNHAPPALRAHPAFTDIEGVHRDMHRHAAQVIRESMAGAVSAGSYDRFVASLRGLRSRLDALIRELRDTVEHLDPLTGANTRNGMLEALRAQHALAARGLQPTSLAMIDLDHFKRINDRFGHQVGDEALARCAQYLLQWGRVYDRVYRYGGEEFLLVMPGTRLPAARRVTERLREGIAAMRIAIQDGEISVTASFGLTQLDPEVSVEENIARADRALYAAKAAGRNRVQTWSPELD